LRVMRDGRFFKVDVAPNGEGLVSHAGSALLGEVADRVGLTRELSRALAGVRERHGKHDPGRVLRDLAVMLADGGDCLSDLRAVRDQQPLTGQRLGRRGAPVDRSGRRRPAFARGLARRASASAHMRMGVGSAAEANRARHRRSIDATSISKALARVPKSADSREVRPRFGAARAHALTRGEERRSRR
jgi:Transposase DDE domain group 1